VIIILQLVIFAIIVVGITYIDGRLWGTYFTPIAILVWPFFILLLISLAYLKANFKQFDLNDILVPIWLIGLLFFWIGGLFVKLIFSKAKINSIHTLAFSNEINITKSKLRLLILLSYPIILGVGLKIYFLLTKFNFNLANQDFRKNLGSGLLAHSILFLTVITIFLIIYFEKTYYKKHQIIIIIFTLLFSIFYGVKSWIIIPLVSAFLGRLLIQKTKLKLKHGLIILIPLVVFWIIYQISLGWSSTNNEFIVRHMADYLLAGPIGFSEHLTQGLPIGTNPEYAFTPLINIFRFIIGEKPLNTISDYFVTIPTGFTPNVKTFFGTLYIYGGYTFIFTSFILGVIFYSYLLIHNYLSNSNFTPFITTLYSFMLGLLFMGWFDIYATQLSFYEVPIIALFLHFIFKLKIKFNEDSIPI